MTINHWLNPTIQKLQFGAEFYHIALCFPLIGQPALGVIAIIEDFKLNPKSYQFGTFTSYGEEYFVDVKTASQTVGVKPKTLYSWASQKKVPHYRANGKLLFNIKEIIDFVKRGRINISGANSEAKIIIGNTMGFRNNPPDSGQVVSRRRRKHV